MPNTISSKLNQKWVFKPASNNIFTNRKKELEDLRGLAQKLGKGEKVDSYILVAPGRLGKSELLRQTFNRLFFEQDRVVPVYIDVLHHGNSCKAFIQGYFSNFATHYIAFKTKDQRIIESMKCGRMVSLELAREYAERMQDRVFLKIVESIIRDNCALDSMINMVLSAPLLLAEGNDLPVIVFIDNFQYLLRVEYMALLDGFQYALDSYKCPHIITGSAMSLVYFKNILESYWDTDLLKIKELPLLNQKDSKELAGKWAKIKGLNLISDAGVEIACRSGGDPFYIHWITGGIRGRDWDQPEKGRTVTPEQVSKMVKAHLRTGGMFCGLMLGLLDEFKKHYYDKLAEPILSLLAVKYPEIKDKEDLERLAREFGNKSVTCKDVERVLTELVQAGFIEGEAPGRMFGLIKDPILREFLSEWGR